MPHLRLPRSRPSLNGFLSSFCITLLTFVPAAQVAAVNVLRTRAEARSLSWQQLEDVFRQGTVEEGYSYGYVLVSDQWPQVTQLISNTFWHGKRFVIDTPTVGHITNTMGNGLVNVQTMPGDLYVGHLEDIRPDLKALQLDRKPSLIVDYGNGGGDEIRLVNSKKRIYLGRGTDWAPAPYAKIFGYFVLQLFDRPRAMEFTVMGVRNRMDLNERIEAAEAGEEEGREEAGDGQVFIVMEPVNKQAIDLTVHGSMREETEEEEVLEASHLRGELIHQSKSEEREGKGGTEGRNMNTKWRELP